MRRFEIYRDEEFAAIAKYIRENPKNWSRDRYGACTSYSFGELELALLDAPSHPMDTARGSSSKTSASADGGAGNDSPVLISTFTSA